MGRRLYNAAGLATRGGISQTPSTHITSFTGSRPLKGFTSYKLICKAWTSLLKLFKLGSLQKMPGLYSFLTKSCGREVHHPF